MKMTALLLAAALPALTATTYEPAQCVPSTQVAENGLPYLCMQTLNENVTFHYRLDEASQNLSVMVFVTGSAAAKATGWIGVTVAEDVDKMGPAAGALANFTQAEDGSYTSTVEGYSVVQPDGSGADPVTPEPTMQFINSSATVNWGGTVSFRFARKLTGDGLKPLDLTQPTYFNVAFGTAPVGNYHLYAHQITVNLRSVPAPVCIPSQLSDLSGTLYACKQLVKPGVWTHWRLSGSTVSLALTSEVMEPGWLGMTLATDRGHMEGARGVIGICTTPGQDCSAGTYNVSSPFQSNLSNVAVPDPEQKLISSSFSYEGGMAVLRYERALKGSGGIDIDVSVPTNINIAASASYPIRGHTFAATFQVLFNQNPAPLCQSTVFLVDDTTEYECTQNIMDGVTMFWRLDRVLGHVSVAVTSPIKGWTGLVVAEEIEKMGPSKGVIGVSTGTVQTYDIIQPDGNYPLTPSTTETLLNSSYSQENGVATLKFARALSGAGGEDYLADAATMLNFAMGPYQTEIEEHSSSDAHQFNVTLGAYARDVVYCTPSTLALSSADSTTYECTQTVDTGVFVHWRMERNTGAVSLAITSPIEKLGWIGLTVAKDAGQMWPAWGPIGYDNNTEFEVGTYEVNNPYSGGAVVVPSTTQELINSSVSFADGVATLRFSRMMTNAGGMDLQADSATNLNFAISPNFPIEIHSNAKAFSILLSAVAQPWSPSQAPSPAPVSTPAPTPADGGCTPSTILVNTAGTTTYECTVDLDSDAGISMHWRIGADSEEVAFALVSTTGVQGWIGLSVAGTEGSMGGATGVIANNLEGKFVIQTYDINSYTSNPILVKNDEPLINSSMETANGAAVFRFARKVVDGQGHPLVLDGTHFNYARSPNVLPAKHNVNGMQTINLVSGSATVNSNKTKKMVHGSIMIAAWIFLVPLGAFLKRYGKGVFGMGINQFYGHIVLMMCAVAFTIVSIAMAKSWNLGTGFKGHGSIMYIIVVIAMSTNPAIGILMYIFARDPNDPKRWIFSYSHKLLGYFLVIFATVQCLYGVESLATTENVSRTPWYVVIFGSLGIFTLAAIWCEVKLLKKKSVGYTEIQH